jgi:hypothetical protein
VRSALLRRFARLSVATTAARVDVAIHVKLIVRVESRYARTRLAFKQRRAGGQVSIAVALLGQNFLVAMSNRSSVAAVVIAFGMWLDGQRQPA